MDVSFDALEPEYLDDLKSAVVQRSVSLQATAVAKKLLVNRDRFLAVQHTTGVPALWLMAVFEREGPSFSDYLGNGQPLDHVTTEVPKARGPFASWEAGCDDALTLDHVTQCPEWTWAAACWEWEKWNGFGPREHGRPSGYLWAGASIYKGGKYVSDGVWSPGTWDKQLGCVVIALAIAAIDAEIGHGLQS